MKPDLYQNKYRISSVRLRNWDYGWNAAYFVTICTKDRACYFGDIEMNGRDTKYCVSTYQTEIGTIANDYWMEIPNHFPFVKLGVHVVMPNHVHGIVVIDKPVETQYFASLPTHNDAPQPKNKFGPQSQNLPSIIRGYKSGVTTYATKNQINFAWQPRYHDHIIRTDKEYHRISDYIINNPVKWAEDKFYHGKT